MEIKPEIRISVDKLVDELNKRISLLTSSKTRSNLNEEAYQQVKNILSSYHKEPSSLTSKDLIDFKLTDIKHLLELIDLEKEEASKIVNSFENRVYSLKNTSLETRMLESMEYFERLRDLVLTYLHDYEDINSNQTELHSKKVQEYNYYIELFTSESFSSLFTKEEIDNLLKLMSNFGLSTSDKQHILQYIAIQNLQIPNLEMTPYGEEYINLFSQVMTKIDLYLDTYPTETEIVKKELEKVDIDIDLIPLTAQSIAKKYNLNGEKVKNIITTLVLNSLFVGYTKAIDNDEEADFIESFKNKIEDVLSIDCQPENAIILEAISIVSENQEFYLNTVEKEKDVSKYLNMVISELEDSGLDRETAVDLKTLPIIKSISDTLDKLGKLVPNSEDYFTCCEMLNELIAVYNSLITKKEKKGINKN